MSDVTTVGSLLINDALPEPLRKQQRVLDKKGIQQLMNQLAEEYPEKYKDVVNRLSEVGRSTAWSEGVSVSLASIAKSEAKERTLQPARKRIQELLNDDSMTSDDRREKIINTLIEASKTLPDAVLQESIDRGDPFALHVQSGARGSKVNLSSLRGADLLTTDSHDQFMPVPLMHSYAEGFTPAEYFAASYGQRRGQLSLKLATADAGYYGKQLANATARQVVTRERPNPTRLPVGLPVDVKDKDNVGAVLAADVGDLKAGQILTQEMLDDLQDGDVDEILIHSPMTEVSEDGGISAWAAGRRQRAGLHQIGDNVGIPAAQSISERLSQGAMDARHTAGVRDRMSRAGFEYINRLTQSPEHFPEAGPLSEMDGSITDIREAPQGGTLVTVGKQEYYLPPSVKPVVKVGDTVEAGDELSDGVPHPTDLVRLRGIGEARRTLLTHYREALENSGVNVSRRNIESVVSGLIDWARVTNPDGIGDAIYDDVVPYSRLAAQYQPRKGSTETPVDRAVGQYLEEPVLHYSPGTRITRKMADYLRKWGIQKAFTYGEPPDFEPNMVRGVHSVYHDPDWRARLSGFYAASAFEKAVARGAESDITSTSFVPAVTRPKGFGEGLPTTGTYGPIKMAATVMALHRRKTH